MGRCSRGARSAGEDSEAPALMLGRAEPNEGGGEVRGSRPGRSAIAIGGRRKGTMALWGARCSGHPLCRVTFRESSAERRFSPGGVVRGGLARRQGETEWYGPTSRGTGLKIKKVSNARVQQRGRLELPRLSGQVSSFGERRV